MYIIRIVNSLVLGRLFFVVFVLLAVFSFV